MVNNVNIAGKIAKADPVIRTSRDGKSKFATFTLAVGRDYKGADGKYPTDFLDVIAGGSRAEYVEKYVRKGDFIMVSGRLEQSTWTDQAGNKRSSVKVNASGVWTVPRSGAAQSQQTQQPAARDNVQQMPQPGPMGYTDGGAAEDDFPWG